MQHVPATHIGLLACGKKYPHFEISMKLLFANASIAFGESRRCAAKESVYGTGDQCVALTVDSNTIAAAADFFLRFIFF